jgi:hypothetical protein
MIMNIEKRETMEQVHKWSFRITTNHKRYFFSFTRSSSSLVVDKKKRETRGRIIGPFLFLVLEKERERTVSWTEQSVCVFSRCSSRKAMFINELLVVSVLLLIFITRYQTYSLLLQPFYWNQTTFRYRKQN